MKYLLLTLLFTLPVYAEFKVEITPSDTSLAKGSFQKPNEAKAKKHLIKIIKKSQWMQGVWNDVVSDLSKVETNLDGSETTSYYHPSNFTYTISDISADIAAQEQKKAAKLARKNKAKAIKNLKKKWKNLNDNQKNDVIQYLMENI